MFGTNKFLRRPAKNKEKTKNNSLEFQIIEPSSKHKITLKLIGGLNIFIYLETIVEILKY